jgi:hypothetical protein
LASTKDFFLTFYNNYTAMSRFEARGNEIRELCKSLVLEFMQATPECQPGRIGMKQSQIFKKCGFEWGSYPLITRSQQQYWIVAVLSALNEDGQVERVSESGPWRLR